MTDEIQTAHTQTAVARNRLVQSERAKRILSEGAENGQWNFHANCHLSISLLPELESIIDTLFKHAVHENFRLILSANPHENFSISLL